MATFKGHRLDGSNAWYAAGRYVVATLEAALYLLAPLFTRFPLPDDSSILVRFRPRFRSFPSLSFAPDFEQADNCRERSSSRKKVIESDETGDIPDDCCMRSKTI